MDPEWDAELRVWDAKNFGPVSPGTRRNKFVKKSLIGLVYSKTNITSVFNALHYIQGRKIHRELESNLGVQASKYVQSLL